VDVSNVAGVSEIHAASISDPEDGGSMYLQTISITAYIVQRPENRINVNNEA
jgi:hypothetical protein